MSVKKYFARMSFNEWVSAVSILALFCCTSVLGWNALSPTPDPWFPPELLMVAALLLGSWLTGKTPSMRFIVPVLGELLVLLGLILLLRDLDVSGKRLLCLGVGCLLDLPLRNLQHKNEPARYFVVFTVCMAIAVLLALIPMLLRTLWLWPVLLSVLMAGSILGFVPRSTDGSQKAPPPVLEHRSQLYWLILLLWALPSLCTGVAYKWRFTSPPLANFANILLFCCGLILFGVMADRTNLKRILMRQATLLILLRLLLLVVQRDGYFSDAVSYFMMGLQLAAFIFFPFFIWPDGISGLIRATGAATGILCLYAIPRAVGMYLPADWLYGSRFGQAFQAIAVVIQFVGFYFFSFHACRFFPGHNPDEMPSIDEAARFRLPDNLTERERDVALLVLEGLSTKDISQKLCIAESTAKTHISNLLSKTQCSSKAQFIATHLHKIR